MADMLVHIEESTNKADALKKAQTLAGGQGGCIAKVLQSSVKIDSLRLLCLLQCCVL